MDKYFNEDLTEKLGLNCFNISVLNEINKSVFVNKDTYMTTTTLGTKWATKETEYYFSEYIPPYRKVESEDILKSYEWNLKEEISFDKNQVIDLPERRKYIREIPFAQPTEQQFCIKYNGEWFAVALMEKTLILF